MTYEMLKEQIKTLPSDAMYRLEVYVAQLCDEYIRRKNVTEKINTFLDNNPNAFKEFKGENTAAMLHTMELTKNDAW